MKKKQLFIKILFYPICFLIVVYLLKSRVDDERYVVILSMDGFRPDYLQRANTPNIDSIISVGLYSELIPCFPTLTFPNHYSMATGMFPDNHGLVSNTFLDRETGKSFAISNRQAVNDAGFYAGDPIWNTVQRFGLQSACFFWVGSDVSVNGQYPNYWKKYDKNIAYKDRVDTVISWLNLPKDNRPDLVMWYIDEPDHAGHTYTPDSAQTLAAVEQCDSVLGYFLTQLRKLPHANKIDFLLVSDHGMSTYVPELSVNLNDYLPRDSFEFVVTGVPCQLYTSDSYKETAYQILKDVPRVNVYKKEDIPKRLHYGSNSRIGDLVLIPERGTYVYFTDKEITRTGGAHGYDNREEEMRAIFCAFGPSFKKNRKTDAFNNVLVYPLVCKLLGIQPSPNDADLDELDRLLKEIKK